MANYKFCHGSPGFANIVERVGSGLFLLATKGLMLLLIHLFALLARLVGPGGMRGLVTGNLLLQQQSLVLGRSRRRALNRSRLE